MTYGKLLTEEVRPTQLSVGGNQARVNSSRSNICEAQDCRRRRRLCRKDNFDVVVSRIIGPPIGGHNDRKGIVLKLLWKTLST